MKYEFAAERSCSIFLFICVCGEASLALNCNRLQSVNTHCLEWGWDLSSFISRWFCKGKGDRLCINFCIPSVTFLPIRAVLEASALQVQHDLRPSLYLAWQSGFCDCHLHDDRRGMQDHALEQLLPCTALPVGTGHSSSCSSCRVCKQPSFPAFLAYLWKSYPAASHHLWWSLTFSILRRSVSP